MKGAPTDEQVWKLVLLDRARPTDRRACRNRKAARLRSCHAFIFFNCLYFFSKKEFSNKDYTIRHTFTHNIIPFLFTFRMLLIFSA